MKLPRVSCDRCGRPIAAGPVAGRLGRGRLFRHDPPGVRRVPGSDLVSCPGSLNLVELPMPARQLQFDVAELPPVDDVDDAQPDEEPTAALF